MKHNIIVFLAEKKQISVETCKRFYFDLERRINEMRYGNIYQNRWVKNILGKLLSVV